MRKLYFIYLILAIMAQSNLYISKDMKINYLNDIFHEYIYMIAFDDITSSKRNQIYKFLDNIYRSKQSLCELYIYIYSFFFSQKDISSLIISFFLSNSSIDGNVYYIIYIFFYLFILMLYVDDTIIAYNNQELLIYINDN